MREEVQTGQPRRSRGARELSVFIHLPKTAGTSIVNVLRANEPTTMLRTANVFKGGGGFSEPNYERMAQRVIDNPQARLLWGHTPFGIAAHLPQEWDIRYITMLRDPVDRAISHYYRVLGSSSGQKRAEALGYEDDVPFDTALSSLDFTADNLQTRMLSGVEAPFEAVTDAMLQQAKDNIAQRFHLVALTERFDESMVLLQWRLGYASILSTSERVNPSRPRGDAIPTELRAAAERHNRYDIELYAFARDLFDASPELEDPDFQIEVAALRQAKSRGPLSAENAPPAPEDVDPETWVRLLQARAELLRERQAHAQVRRRMLAIRQSNERLKKAAERSRSQAERHKRVLKRLESKLSGAGVPRRSRRGAPDQTDDSPETPAKTKETPSAKGTATRLVDAAAAARRRVEQLEQEIASLESADEPLDDSHAEKLASLRQEADAKLRRALKFESRLANRSRKGTKARIAGVTEAAKPGEELEEEIDGERDATANGSPRGA